MRKTPNALNTREQGKEGREGEVGKDVGRDEEWDCGRRGRLSLIHICVFLFFVWQIFIVQVSNN